MKQDKRPRRLLDSIFSFFLLLSFVIFLGLSTSIIIFKNREFTAKTGNTYRERLDQQKEIIKQKIDDIEKLALFQKEQLTIPPKSRENFLRFISEIRFGQNDNGYIYIVQRSTGKIIMHPLSQGLVGRDVRTIYDPDGVGIGLELYKVIDSAGMGFFNYSWLQPSSGEIVPKIGYARYLPEYDWILATGVYVKDITDEIQGYRIQLKRSIFWSTLAILGVLGGGLIVFGFFLYVVKKRFTGDVAHVSEYFKEAAVKGERIDTNELAYQELQDLGGYLNLVIKENHRIYQDLKNLAEHDHLTGLLNRRKFFEHLEREFLMCQRYNHRISLLMMDLDHFKRVNDIYGHDAGDLVLKLFSELCRNSIRKVDIAGRIGGEEFAVLMPATERVSAVTVAERIRDTMAQKSFTYGKKSFSVTISIGLVSVPPEMLESPTALFKKVDELLYVAKDSGRNKVCY